MKLKAKHNLIALVIIQKLKKIKIYTFFYLLIIITTSFGCKSKKEITNNINNSKVTEAKKIKIETYFVDAMRHKIIGNTEIAEELLNKTLKEDPKNGACYFELSKIKKQKNNLIQALNYINKSIKYEPQNRWYLEYKIFILKALKKNEEIIKTYQKLITIYPNKKEYYENIANMFVYLGNYKKAIETYNIIEEKKGFSDEISEKKISIFTHTQNYKSLIKELEKQIERHPNNFNYYGELAKTYTQIGKKQAAIKTYEKLLNISSKKEDPYIQISLAEYYINGGQKQKGFGMFKKAFRNKKLNPKTKIQIMFSYFRANSEDKEWENIFYKLCDTIIKTHPENAEIYSLYGDLLYNYNKHQKALEIYEIAVKKDPAKYVLWHQILMMYYEQSNFDKLEKQSKKALEYFPLQPIIYLYEGIALHRNKKYIDAKNTLEEGISLIIDPYSKIALNFYSCIGNVYYELKEYKKCFKNYELAIKINTDDAYLLNNYAYYLSVVGVEVEKAEKMAEKCIKKEPNSAVYLDTYAWVLFKAKKYTKALENIKKAYNLGGKNIPEIISHFGDILYKLGKIDMAVEKWNEALEKEITKELEERIRTRKIPD